MKCSLPWHEAQRKMSPTASGLHLEDRTFIPNKNHFGEVQETPQELSFPQTPPSNAALWAMLTSQFRKYHSFHQTKWLPLSTGHGSYLFETTEKIKSHRRKGEKDTIKTSSLFTWAQLPDYFCDWNNPREREFLETIKVSNLGFKLYNTQ